jgi:hypothetical protein
MHGSTRASGGIATWLPRDLPGLFRIGLVVIVVWLVYPVLTPVHVEGFSASIESLSIHLANGSLGDFDRLHPANLEFFALTRLGIVEFVAALIAWLGIRSEWAMRVSMWAGFATLVWGSIVLVRRWTGASIAMIVATLVLIPGISESAFFYNDNVLSAALAIAALALLASSARIGRTAIAGLLFGAGVVARLDAVLLAPAVALIAYEQHDRMNGDVVRRALAFTVATLLPVVLLPAAVGASIVDVVRISNYGVALWQLPSGLAPHAREVAYFVGVPAALLAAFGILQLVRDRAAYRLVLLVGSPLFFNLVGLGKILRSRQLLPLAPFIAALAIFGVRYLVADDKEGSRARLRLTVLVVSAVVVFGPVARLQMSDGPRTPYGRFWSPRLWTRWQSAVRSNMRGLATLVESFNAHAVTAVLTDSWDGDRYLHLQLQREGFRIHDIETLEQPCSKAGELFVRGSTRVLHLRLHQPFLPAPAAFAFERLNKLALPCLSAVRPAQSYLLSAGAQVIPRVRAWPALAPRTDVQALIASFFATGYDPLVVVPLVPSDLAPMTDSFAAAAADSPARSRDAGVDLARAERLMAVRIWHPDEVR